MTNIVCLYPDAADVPCKQVMSKLDRGPGQKDMDCNARLQSWVFISLPMCLQHNCRHLRDRPTVWSIQVFLFKKICVTFLLIALKITNLSHSHLIFLAFFVFGGTDPETKIGGYCNAFGDAFTCPKCKAVWEQVGAIPTTRVCLQNPKVRRELNTIVDKEDPMQLAMQEMEVANSNLANLLSILGDQGVF